MLKSLNFRKGEWNSSVSQSSNPLRSGHLIHLRKNPTNLPYYIHHPTVPPHPVVQSLPKSQPTVPLHHLSSPYLLLRIRMLYHINVNKLRNQSTRSPQHLPCLPENATFLASYSRKRNILLKNQSTHQHRTPAHPAYPTHLASHVILSVPHSQALH